MKRTAYSCFEQGAVYDRQALAALNRHIKWVKSHIRDDVDRALLTMWEEKRAEVRSACGWGLRHSNRVHYKRLPSKGDVRGQN